MTEQTIALIQRAGTPEWAEEVVRSGFVLRRFADPDVLLQPRGRTFRLVVLSDFAGGTWAAIEAARKLRTISPNVPIVLVAVQSSEASAIAALKAGVNDYLNAPVSPDEFLNAVTRLSDRIVGKPAVIQVRPISNGQVGLSPSVGRSLLARLAVLISLSCRVRGCQPRARLKTVAEAPLAL